MQERQKGLLMTAAGVLLLSPDALVLRWVSADPLHILAWRVLLGGGIVLLALAGHTLAGWRAAGRLAAGAA